MSWTVISHTGNGTSPSGGSTSAIDTTGADLIVISISDYAPSSSVLTDSKSNTWVALTAVTNGSQCRNQLYYCKNPTTDASHVFTITGAAYPTIAVLALSGSGASPFDVENGAGETSASSLQPGSISPAANGEIIISGVCGVVFSLAIDSGFTISDSAIYNGNYFTGGMAYFIQSTAAAINPTWSWSSGEAASAIASFKVSAGGGTTNGTLAAAPTATCAFVGSSTASSTFASTPSATCAWTGASTFTGTLVSSPNATCAWTGLAQSIGTLASTSTATCSFTGASLFTGVLASTPNAVCLFININSGTFASTPSAVCAFTGLVQDQGVLASSALVTCSFTGKATFKGIFASTPNAVCAFVGAEITDINTYLRRYLNDQVSMSSTGPAEDLDTSTEDDDTVYIRRYLNDKV